MRVAIDCRFGGLHAGLGRYTRELVMALLKVPQTDLQFSLIVRSKDEPWLQELFGSPTLFQANFPHYSLAEQMRLPEVIRASKAQLLYSPHFNVPLRCPVPFVATVHDLILHRYPNSASLMKKTGYRLLMRHVMLNAQSVVTVSDFVAGEIRAAYGDKVQGRLHTLYEGVHPRFAPQAEGVMKAVREQYGLPARYFFYVGNAKQHKNVPLLLRAFEAAQLPETGLVLLTGGREAEALRLPKNVQRISGVSDADLPALYSGALACVTASLYEGFCLPAVEALACGCPVIAADRGPLGEVTKGHALLIEPTVEAFAAAFKAPPADRTARRLWRWEEVATATIDVLRDTTIHNVGA